MTRRIHILLALSIFAALVASGCSRKNEAATAPVALDPAIQVSAELPGLTDWAVSVPVSGTLQTRSKLEIRTEVAGRLIAAELDEGSTVRRGDLVAEIDPVNYRLAYDQVIAALGVARAGVRRTQVAVDHARNEKERADNLLRTGGITQKDHEAATTGVKEAESQLALAQAQVVQAEAAVAVAKKSLDDCKVFASAGGQVQKKFLDRGTLVAAGTPLYVLVDNSQLELECLVPSYRLAEVRPGLRVRFTTPTFADRAFEGVVHALNPMVETDNRSIRVVVRISNPRGELRAGMFAKGEVETGTEKNALVIPRSALMGEQDSIDIGSVFVIEGGKARRRQVKLGGARLDRVWVREGLKRDDQVVTEIGPSLKDGSDVVVAARPAKES